MIDVVDSLALVAIAILVPVLVVLLEGRSKIVQALSPVVLCYGTGMALGNQQLVKLPVETAEMIYPVAVALAIPLLLFSTDVLAWLRLARNTVLSYLFCMISVLITSGGLHFAFRNRVEDAPAVSGMLVGVYVGGTPNMASIAMAMDVDKPTFMLVNAADVAVCLVYLVFLLTVGQRILAKVLPPFQRRAGRRDSEGPKRQGWKMPPLKQALAALGLAALIMAIGAGAGALVPETASMPVTILGITTLAVGASFVPRVRALEGTHDLGQFLLLVFCVAIGIVTDFSQLLETRPAIISYVALVVFGSLTLHILLCIVFRVDRDTMIVTSIAAIFGPHLVGAVAMNLKNREIVFSGIASGLVGYAVGNYLGMGLAWLLALF